MREEPTLSPGNFIEAKRDANLMESFSNQIAAFGWNVIVSFPKNHDQLALDVLCSV